MIYGFYFRFLRLTHNTLLSAVFAKLARAVYFVMYLFQRIAGRTRIVKGDPDKAREMIADMHPDPLGRPIIKNAPLNESIDLSIIVPVYNYASLICKNIESILNQDTQYCYELIIVDDGSTDGAREIVRSYETDDRVNVICQENQGIAGARNTGLQHASGKYVAFVDCDDVVTSDLVETLLAKAFEGDYDIVMCGHNLVKEKDGSEYAVIPNVYAPYNLSGYCKDAEILNYAGLPWGKVYKRELWENVRFLPGYWYEDTIIHALLFLQCKKFAYVPKVCYQYRWYENNFSHTQSKAENPKCIDRYWMLLPILEKAKELKLLDSDRFYTMLLKHLSAYYYPTIAGLGQPTVDALFVLACELYRQYRPKRKVKLPYMLRVTEKALDRGDIELWKLAIKYQ